MATRLGAGDDDQIDPRGLERQGLAHAGPRGHVDAQTSRASRGKVLAERRPYARGEGVITRTEMPTSPPSVEYALTDLGSELIPAIAAIVRVGERLEARRPGG